MTLYLVRHGETAWNRSGRYQGQSDPPLSKSGWCQAEEAAARLGGVRLDAIYSSDLRRAASTARVLAVRASVPPTRVYRTADLREIDFGCWEGLTYREIQQRWGDALQSWYRDPVAYTPPGGEPFARFCYRVARFFLEIARRHRGAAVAVVTHGGVLALTERWLCGEPCRPMGRSPVPPGGVLAVSVFSSAFWCRLKRASTGTKQDE